MSKYYKAQIYLISCTHPLYSELKYIGLDTKLDPAYMSSSTVVKWHINKLGRKFFTKTILETIEGTMSEICEVEQGYIREYNSVRDPNFMNMSGGRKILSSEEMLLNMDWNIAPVEYKSKDFIDQLVAECSKGFRMFSHSRQLMVRILSMTIYGYLKYSQESYDYSQFTDYGSSKSEDTQLILTALSNNGIIDSSLDTIRMTEELIERLEDSEVRYKHFKVIQLY